MLIKRKSGEATRTRLQAMNNGLSSGVLDRRSFLTQSGLALGGVAAIGSIQLGAVRKAEAGPVNRAAPVEIRKNICTHCSVGCSVTAEVQNGVWVGQEPAWDSPINRGTHCAKGASVRELVHGDRRIKYPMKLVNGEWQRLSWETAISEISSKMVEIRDKSGADSVFMLGSAKMSNEGAYLFRKFGAFWGTNSVDHQARICHSTTVAGVANTWGYGAQTNSYNDIRNSKTIIIMGGNPAEAHPVSLQHVLSGKEINRANLFVIDPRFTRTAAHATEYVRMRPGTDIPIIWGMLHHIFANGWEDKDFIAKRVYGMDEVRKEVAKWTPEEVERVTGIPGEQLKRVAQTFATQKPSTLIWCMGANSNCPAPSCWVCCIQLPTSLNKASGLRAVSGGVCAPAAPMLTAASRQASARQADALAAMRRMAGAKVWRHSICIVCRRLWECRHPGIWCTCVQERCQIRLFPSASSDRQLYRIALCKRPTSCPPPLPA